MLLIRKYRCDRKGKSGERMMMPSIIVQILYVLWMATMVPGETYTAECDHETLTVRAGFREHPTYCSKFIQCLLNKDGQLVSIVRDCGYGTYWNQTFLTCTLATRTVCKHDLCYQQPDGKRRKGHGNCRGFYECQGSSSVPRCCPLGQYLHSSQLVCVNNTADITCNHRCLDTMLYTHSSEPFKVGGTLNPLSKSQGKTMLSDWQVNSGINQQTPVDIPLDRNVNAKTICDKTGIPENPLMYKQTLYGEGWVVKGRCPNGTIFVQAVCNCVSLLDQTNIPNPNGGVLIMTQITMCRPKIYLPFTLDERDRSSNAYEIINHNVTVRNGKAIFDGKENYIMIPIFSSLDITNSLVIKVIYSSDHESIPSNRFRTIFSNDGCNEAPNVYMYENWQHIIGGVGTEPYADMSKDARILQRPNTPGQQSSTKEVMFVFHGGEFTIKNGNRSQTIHGKGNLNKLECPLKIGYGADILPFKGEIDEFTVYMCQNVKRFLS
ncbi:protein PIF-like isoform X1 [Mya arenaria]|uniref:protein PIF-like isoform X1 n=2 Tax=Mya arenaria TaxID=6604 RepID=UPI0022E1ADA2|nr:protein PIF-like isoform X1 [Mya arenaria]